MKKMYWRPRRVSRTVLLLISLVSLGGYAAIQLLPIHIREPFHQEKLAAARVAEQAFKELRTERLRRGLRIDPETDPAQTGMIGSLMTPVTTNPGSLGSKQTSVNPNFAAVIVHYLMKAGVSEGDVVAVGYSGSFPAVNVAVLAAIETMKLKPVIITSAASSQWGANDPELLWLDMERALFDKKIISARSIAASIGGIEDRGLGMTRKGRMMLERSIERSQVKLIDPESFLDGIERRFAAYREFAQGPIKAYINVGGGTVSVGRKVGKLSFKPGLNRRLTVPAGVDSVMGRFIEEGVPVIHLVKINDLADRYGLGVQPRVMPPVGEGKIYFREDYNRWLVAALLAFILASLYLFVRSDIGFRITRRGDKGGDRGHPEPMV